MRFKKCFALLLCSTLWACDKEKTSEELPGPVSNIQTITFRYSPPQVTIPVTEYELILSRRDGEVVLDTLLAVDVEHKLKVKSSETKFDITTISYEPFYKWYYMNTYVQINLDKWHLARNNSQPSGDINSASARIIFTNVKYEPNYIFQTNQTLGMGGTWTNNSFETRFNRLAPADLAYMLLPSQERYAITDVLSDNTEVDFAVVSLPTQKHVFTNKPTNITGLSMTLSGYPKTGEFSKKLLIDRMPRNLANTSTYDLQYPSNKIAAFEAQVSYLDAESYHHTYNHTGPTIPATLPFLTLSDFQVGPSANFDLLEVSFRGQTPALYKSYWQSIDPNLSAQWVVHASPADKTFKGNDFMGKIKPKYLSGKNTAIFQLTRVETNSAPGYDYSQYLGYMANPDKRSKVEMKQHRSIYKSF